MLIRLEGPVICCWDVGPGESDYLGGEQKIKAVKFAYFVTSFFLKFILEMNLVFMK